VKRSSYVPAQGDVVWLDFSPQAGHEQGGRRPALILSPTSYNKRIGLALVCPLTKQAKGYPFEVELPPGLPVAGVVLSDHMKSQDWRARRAEFIASLDKSTVAAVIQRARTLLAMEEA
jgi:mRNA interferase MazF